MGRSKWINQPLKDYHDSSLKKQKSLANSHGAASAKGGDVLGENTSEQGKMALYHCNYCSKDISFILRIRCSVCSDFDLCVECFSVGAQVTPHSSNHSYRVMENLSFPLLSPDWNIDEEILLLEALAMYGFGNWSRVAEHICTKTKTDSMDHYYSYYMNSPCFPLPDLSHVMGKTKEELIVATKSHHITKQNLFLEIPAINDIKLPEESSLFHRIEDNINQPTLISKKGNVVDGKKEDSKQSDRLENEDDALEMNGYNSKRQEFEVEYDNDAEHILADMEFNPNDTDCEREMKLRALRIYSKRLDERKRRKSFILERNVLSVDSFMKQEVKEIHQHLKVFARFHSKEEHEELVRVVAEERLIMERIHDIQEARAAGLKTSSELKCFIEGKRGEQMTMRDDVWDLSGFVGAEFLSEDERKFCGEMRMIPAEFLHMLESMSDGIAKKTIESKEEARQLFNSDFAKVDRVYDMLIAKSLSHGNVP